MKSLELVSDYTPSGDQPTAINQLLDGIDSGLSTPNPTRGNGLG